MPTTDVILKLQETQHAPRVIRFNRGAYGPKSQFNFTIQNKDGTPYDISGQTLNMVLFEKYRRIAVSERELTNVSDSDGTAKYVPLEGDFDLLGYHYIRVSIFGGSDKQWTEEVILQIE